MHKKKGEKDAGQIHFHYHAGRGQKTRCFAYTELKQNHGIAVTVGRSRISAGLTPDGDIIIEIRGPVVPRDPGYIGHPEQPQPAKKGARRK